MNWTIKPVRTGLMFLNRAAQTFLRSPHLGYPRHDVRVDRRPDANRAWADADGSLASAVQKPVTFPPRSRGLAAHRRREPVVLLLDEAELVVVGGSAGEVCGARVVEPLGGRDAPLDARLAGLVALARGDGWRCRPLEAPTELEDPGRRAAANEAASFELVEGITAAVRHM